MASNVKSLKSAYEKAVKKEQSLSSLMLVNLVKYKAAKASGDEKAIAKFTKIAGQLSPKKKKASEEANTAYQAYEDKISGLHADAELEIDENINEVRKLIKKMIIKEAGVFDTPDTTEPAGEDQSRVMSKLQDKFEGPVKGIINLIKTKDDLNAAVSMLISKSEETTSGLGRKAKVLLLKTVKEL